MSDYITTKAQCQAQIDANGKVCEQCGDELVPIDTVDNAGHPTFWSGCWHGGDCGSFTFGVDAIWFSTARQLTLDGERYYSHISKSDDEEEYIRAQTCGLSRLLARADAVRRQLEETANA